MREYRTLSPTGTPLENNGWESADVMVSGMEKMADSEELVFSKTKFRKQLEAIPSGSKVQVRVCRWFTMMIEARDK